MSRKMVVVCMLLIFLAQITLAEEADTQTGVANIGGSSASSQSLDSQNRYLSAEVSRQIKTAKEDIIQAVNDNNDDNFRLFDQRMNNLMQDTRIKVILGGIGAILIANAIAALILIRSWKKYSYEAYLENLLKKKEKEQPQQTQEVPQDAYQQAQLQQMQQTEWYPQQPQESLGMRYGQAQASDMSYVNQWQTQPAYAGAWQSPVETQPMPSNTWQQAHQQQYQDQYQDWGWNNG